MAEPNEHDKKNALALCNAYRPKEPGMAKAIARALAAAREQATPPKGHVMLDDGTVRKVLHRGAALGGSGTIWLTVGSAESARATP